MALSSEELKRIHLNKIATPGKKYYGDNEEVYVGTSERRLKLLDKASQVITNNNITVQESTNNITDNITVMQTKLDTINLGEIAAFAAAN